MNKKGNLMVLGGLVLLVLVFIVGAFFITVGSGVLTYSVRTINDVTTGLGMVGDTNMSAISDVSIGTLNNSISMLQWGSGIILVFCLLGIIIFAGSIRMNPNGFLIGLYLILMLVMIFVSILMSNTYEVYLGGSDVIATELAGMTMASFMVLYMPMIITIMGFIGGIIIFSGLGEETV
jgi:hypothetical protein